MEGGGRCLMERGGKTFDGRGGRSSRVFDWNPSLLWWYDCLLVTMIHSFHDSKQTSSTLPGMPPCPTVSKTSVTGPSGPVVLLIQREAEAAGWHLAAMGSIPATGKKWPTPHALMGNPPSQDNGFLAQKGLP